MLGNHSVVQKKKNGGRFKRNWGAQEHNEGYECYVNPILFSFAKHKFHHDTFHSLCKRLIFHFFLFLYFSGFERRRCETSGKWEPEAPICKETLCKPLEKPANGSMILTTLRIGGRATFTCNEGFSLQGEEVKLRHNTHNELKWGEKSILAGQCTVCLNG